MTGAHHFRIIIPVKELNDNIQKCLIYISVQRHTNYSVFLLPNTYLHYSENTVVHGAELSNDPYFFLLPCFPAIRDKLNIIPTGKKSPAVKRDLAAFTGPSDNDCEILAFIDDDAYPAADWLSNANNILQNSAIHGIGGPAVTPDDDSFLAKASGIVFESFFGGGTCRYRYRPTGSQKKIDDFPSVNLLIRRDAFLASGGFDSNFWPGEDTKFCLDFTKAGYSLLYSPDVSVMHHRRKLFIPHLRQIAGYGLHRGYFVRKFPRTSCRAGYFLPSVLVLFFIFGFLLTGILSERFPSSRLVFFYSIIIYIFLCIFDCYRVSGKPHTAVIAGLGVIATHAVYGTQFLRGVLFKRDLISTLR